jgi:hypothetical protein
MLIFLATRVNSGIKYLHSAYEVKVQHLCAVQRPTPVQQSPLQQALTSP